MSKVVLYQPDIAGNVGTIIRTCVCFDVELHIIEPCGFPFDMERVKRSAMDYANHAKIFRHSSFDIFYKEQILQNNKRLILATTKGAVDYRSLEYRADDFVMFGKETSGVPDEVATKAHQRVVIPMKNQMRCLNVAISCGIILSRSL
jgi:tRNA (cytidine/uridine-2'-O-)-methyltransferase